MSNKPMPYVKRGIRQARNEKLGWRLRPQDPKSGRQLDRTFFGTYDEAVVELSRFVEEREASVASALPSAKTVTVGGWAEAWLMRYKWKVPPTRTQSGQRRNFPTLAKHKSVLSAYVIPSLGPDTKLHKITYDMLVEAIADLTLANGQTPASASTKATVVSSLSLMFRDAVRAGVLTANPAAGLPTNWGPTRRSTLIPSLQEAQALACEMDKRPHTQLGDITRLITFTGLRIEEITGLRTSEVDFKRRTIWIERSVTESGGRRNINEHTKTDAGIRSVIILDQAVEPLERLIEYSRSVGSKLVACGVRGGFMSYGWWRSNLRIAREISGVNYTAHELRHVCASMLIASGANIETVREQMGHERVSTTQGVYRHALKLDRSKLAGRLSRAVTELYAESE